MALDSVAMANSIVDKLDTAGKLAGLSTAEKNQLKADTEIFCDGVIEHIVNNMEIKNVNVSATGVIDTPITPVPVPTDGGAAILATMISNTATKSLSQNNNGTGLVE